MKIALTGGVACGKSQVARCLKNLGADIIDLDEISRQVVMPNTEGLKALVVQFGEEILQKNGSLDRAKLRDILLKNCKNKTLIETILHPKILQKMQKNIEKCQKSLIIVELPLLFEQNLTYLFDRVIIVDCSKQNQLKTLQKRDNIDENLAKKLISTQMSRENRLNHADKLPTDIIQNNFKPLDLTQKTQNLYQKLLKL
jgi:dephospho-CoA kinase